MIPGVTIAIKIIIKDPVEDFMRYSNLIVNTNHSSPDLTACVTAPDMEAYILKKQNADYCL